jgi:drug/metabolite transporter (DMT)-like permease
MFISELKGGLPLLQLARWQMIAGFVMTSIIATVRGDWPSISLWQFEMLAASSLFGIAFASTTCFAAIYAVGPRLTALLFSLTSPFALGLGYIFLGETITAAQALGIVLILIGIVLAIGMPRRFLPAGTSAPELPVIAPATMPLAVASAPPKTGPLLPGIVLGVVTALGQALGSMFARPVMESGMEPFTAMAIRSGLAALFFVTLLALPLSRAPVSPRRMDVGIAVASAFFGTVLGMSLLMAALHRGDVGIVSTLSSMTPVLILPLVWMRSGERPPARAWLGALLAIGGTAFVSL